MNIDTVFIPCAGFGKRMGRAGEVIPKPLWTVGDFTLLEYKIFQLEKLGFHKFIVNTHHQYKRVEEFVKSSNKDIIISYEPEILGNGGSFHKIKKDYHQIKKVLVTNPDTFFFLTEKDWKSFLGLADKMNNVLVAVPCKQDDSYNRLVTNGVKLERIEKYKEGNVSSNITYSGIGIVDLRSFDCQKGHSSFFESVIIPSQNDTLVFKPSNGFEFYDFGTLENYKNMCVSLEGKSGTKIENLVKDFYSKRGIGINSTSFKRGFILDNYGSKGKIKID